MSDALVALSFGQHPQHLNFARRERLGHASRLRIDEQPIEVARLQHDETSCRSFYGGYDLRDARVPGQNRSDPRSQRFGNAGQSRIISHYYPGRFGRAVGDVNRKLVAILFVGQNDIGIFPGVFGPSGKAAYYLYRSSTAEQRFEPGASNRCWRQHKDASHAASALPAANLTATSR